MFGGTLNLTQLHLEPLACCEFVYQYKRRLSRKTRLRSYPLHVTRDIELHSSNCQRYGCSGKIWFFLHSL